MPPKEHSALTRARSHKDVVVLCACLAFLASLGLLLAWLASLFPGLASDLAAQGGAGMPPARDADEPEPTLSETLWSYGFLLLAVLLFGFVAIRVMRQTFLGNGLDIRHSDFAWLRDWSHRVARDLGMPPVEIFIVQNPVINAFAFGFRRPFTIVLHSGTVLHLRPDELKAIVLHEMAHIKYKHTHIRAWMTPIFVLPVVGMLATWVTNFWSRRAELTCDRLALTYTGDPDLVARALIKVHVGPGIADTFTDQTRLHQIFMTQGPFQKFSRSFSDHPFLVRRLEHLAENAHLAGRATGSVSFDNLPA